MYIDIEILKEILFWAGLMLTAFNWVFNIIVIFKIHNLKSGGKKASENDIMLKGLQLAGKSLENWIKNDLPELMPTIKNIIHFDKPKDNNGAAQPPADTENKDG